MFMSGQSSISRSLSAAHTIMMINLMVYLRSLGCFNSHALTHKT